MIRQRTRTLRVGLALSAVFLLLGNAFLGHAEEHSQRRGNPLPFKELTQAERDYPQWAMRNTRHVGSAKVAALQARLPRVLSDPRHVAVLCSAGELSLETLKFFGRHLNDHQQRQVSLGFGHLRSHPLARCIFVTARPFADVAWDRTGEQLAGGQWPTLRRRLRRFSVDDDSFGWLSSKLLTAPAKLHELREMTEGRPAFLLPFNMGGELTDISLALDMPILGPNAEQLWAGHKTMVKLFAERAGLETPPTLGGLSHECEMADAVLQFLEAGYRKVWTKSNTGASGGGNVKVSFNEAQVSELLRLGRGDGIARLLDSMAHADPSFVRYIDANTNFERLFSARDSVLRSEGMVVQADCPGTHDPSVQAESLPDGVRVLATGRQHMLPSGGFGGITMAAGEDFRWLPPAGMSLAKVFHEQGIYSAFSADFRGNSEKGLLIEINLRNTAGTVLEKWARSIGATFDITTGGFLLNGHGVEVTSSDHAGESIAELTGGRTLSGVAPVAIWDRLTRSGLVRRPEDVPTHPIVIPTMPGGLDPRDVDKDGFTAPGGFLGLVAFAKPGQSEEVLDSAVRDLAELAQ